MDVEKTIEFILDQQAQATAKIQELAERQNRAEVQIPNARRTPDFLGRCGARTAGADHYRRYCPRSADRAGGLAGSRLRGVAPQQRRWLPPKLDSAAGQAETPDQFRRCCAVLILIMGFLERLRYGS